MKTNLLSVPAVLLAIMIGILPASAAAQDADSAVLRHVVVMGASVSAGHGTGAEIQKYGRDVPLAEVLRAMIRAESVRFTDLADELFIIAPESTGAEMVGKAVASKPSCVIAVDFLFWYAYGNLKSLDHRQRRLAKGLELLERFECPLLISELPDMRRAIEGGRMNPKRVPDREMLRALNCGIVDWAKPRKNVLIVPLGRLLADLFAGKAVTAGKATWKPPLALRELLQPDMLHPSVTGLGMTASLCLQVLVAKKLVAASALQLDARAAAKRVIAARRGREPGGKKP